MKVELRDPVAEDAPIFYAHQLQPAALLMAAFGSRDRDAFMAHWAKIKEDPSVQQQTILADGRVAGYVGSFERLGNREVCYWLDQDVWGKGVATRGLSAFLDKEIRRPLWARVAKCNPASVRVVEKCGFKVIGEDKYANAAGQEVEEFLLKLG
jgi:RimJ/RimL family protein N-acetyltransferase